MIKIFADTCVHTDVVVALRTGGFNVIRAQEIGLTTACDEKIFRYIKSNRLILLTFDRDFGDFSVFDPTDTCGIVIVYIERMSRMQIIKETVKFFHKTELNSLRNTLVIIEPDRIRKAKPSQ
ncbi:MAG: DUF5615 family PIN-like protein [Elusimicrobiota bacterium]